MTRETLEEVEARWSIGAQTLGMAIVIATLLGAAFGVVVITLLGAFPLVTLAGPIGAAIGGVLGLAVGIPLAIFVGLAKKRLPGRQIALGMHVVTLLATLGLAATFIRSQPMPLHSRLELVAFFVVSGQLGVAILVRWYLKQWPDPTRRTSGIAITAFGAWATASCTESRSEHSARRFSACA